MLCQKQRPVYLDVFIYKDCCLNDRIHQENRVSTLGNENQPVLLKRFLFRFHTQAILVNELVLIKALLVTKNDSRLIYIYIYTYIHSETHNIAGERPNSG